MQLFELFDLDNPYVSLPPQPSVFLALQSVQVCEREAWLRQAGGALSGEERVKFLKVVTDDEPYEHCCK